MRLTVRVTVCPLCLGPETGCDPECVGTAGNGTPDAIDLEVAASGTWEPAERARWSEWDGGDPGSPGGWDGSPDCVVRADTGAEVALADLPEPTLALIDAALVEAAEEWALDRADEAAEDRADRERDDWRLDR